MCGVACVYAGAHAPVCMYVLRTDVDIRCLPQSFSAIYIYIKESFTEPKATNSARIASWPSCHRAPPVHPSPEQGLQCVLLH